MTPEQQREVWTMLDGEHLAQIAKGGPEPIFATISGAHLYGFASPDSDVDLRGAFLLPARAVLGLHPPTETISIEDKTTVDLDWVAHDVRKFARMMNPRHPAKPSGRTERQDLRTFRFLKVTCLRARKGTPGSQP